MRLAQGVFVTSFVALITCAVLAGVLQAHSFNGGANIAAAPTVSSGQQEFGNTTDGSWNNNPADFWKLSLIAADHVTIDWSSSSDSNGPTYARSLFIWPAGTSDFSINNVNNLQTFGIGSNGKAESIFTANKSGVFPIMFCCGTGGPYNFTAYVKHLPVLSFPTPRTVAPGMVVSIAAHYADGTPISDNSLRISVFGRWSNASHLLGVAAPGNGRAAIRLAIPRSLHGKTIGLMATAVGTNYLARHTATRTVRVR